MNYYENTDEEALSPLPIKQQLDYLVESVLAGCINPIEAAGAIKLFSKALEEANKAIKDSAIEELRKHKEGFENDSVKVELRNTATRYDYKHIKEWSTKKGELKNIETSAKQAALSYAKGQTIVDENGEIIEAAISSGGNESIFITVKK